jgi:hypothetical protein
MSPDDMTVLINDKFLNWKTLLGDLIQKKIEQKHYSQSLTSPNIYMVHRDELIQDIDWNVHNCEKHMNELSQNHHSLATKIIFSPSEFLFLQFE